MGRPPSRRHTDRMWRGRRVAETRALVLEVYGTICHLCGGPGADSPDHVVPRSKGGGNNLENFRPAHLACNVARGDMDLADWFARHPARRPTLPPSSRWAQ